MKPCTLWLKTVTSFRVHCGPLLGKVPLSITVICRYRFIASEAGISHHIFPAIYLLSGTAFSTVSPLIGRHGGIVPNQMNEAWFITRLWFLATQSTNHAIIDRNIMEHIISCHGDTVPSTAQAVSVFSSCMRHGNSPCIPRGLAYGALWFYRLERWEFYRFGRLCVIVTFSGTKPCKNTMLIITKSYSK